MNRANDWDEQERRLAAELGLPAGGRAPACIHPDRLRAYGAEALDDQTRAHVASHLAACPSCAALARQFESWGAPDAPPDDVQALWAGISHRLGPALRPAQPRSPRRWLWWPALAAACTAAAAIVTLRVPEIAPPSYAGPALPSPALRLLELAKAEPAPVRLPLDGLLVWRSQGEAQPVPAEILQLTAALQPYRQGDFPAAASRLGAFAAAHPASFEGWFYHGVALLMAHRDPEAETSLLRALPLAPPSSSEETRWYLALARLRRGAVTQARPALESHCRTNTSFAPQACEILREMAAPAIPLIGR